jgi:hypothetical protein
VFAHNLTAHSWDEYAAVRALIPDNLLTLDFLLSRCVRDSFSCWFEPLSRCENAPYLEGELPGCRSDAIVSGAEAAVNEEGGRACVPNMGYRNSSLSQ